MTRILDDRPEPLVEPEIHVQTVGRSVEDVVEEALEGVRGAGLIPGIDRAGILQALRDSRERNRG